MLRLFLLIHVSTTEFLKKMFEKYNFFIQITLLHYKMVYKYVIHNTILLFVIQAYISYVNADEYFLLQLIKLHKSQ